MNKLDSIVTRRCLYKGLLIISLLLSVFPAHAVPLLISITNPPPQVNATAVGDTQFWPNAGTLGVGGTPISLRATVVNISAGDSIRFFTSGDNPVVRANTGSLSATVLWEVFDAATGLPITGDPDFLITDIDGRNGIPIESVSAACAGLTSYTTNGNFLAGCNANTNNACQSNIRVSESGGSILAEGTQNQNGNQQESYMQYSWTGVSSWTVSYFATTGGRWFVHDADGDIPFDGTRVDINLVDLATIKGVAPGSLTSPAQNEQITFKIDLSNLGPSNATNANLTDLLPAGLNYLSHVLIPNDPNSGTYNPVNGLWSGVNVLVGETKSLEITAEVTATAGTTITNQTTTALADESICSSRDALEYSFVVAETPAPSLTVDKSVSSATSFSEAGDTITYQYVIENTGNVNIDNVVPVDGGPTFGGQPATNLLSGSTPVVYSPSSATIAPGGSQTFTTTYILDQVDIDNLALDANPLTGIENSATATGAPADGALPPVIASTVETGLSIAPNLSVVKSVSSATSFSGAGDTITFEYLITNTGNVTIDSVSPLDAGPTFNGAAAVNSLGAFAPPSVSLPPGASQTFSATYELDQADVDNIAAAADPLTAISNTASATGDPVGATPLPVIPNSSVTTGLTPAPGLSVLKELSTATSFSSAGDTITYQYTVENTGNVTVNDVVPVDTGPTFNGVAAANSLSGFAPTTASIAPGGNTVFTASYVLDQADVDNMFAATDPATAIENSATAQGNPVGGTLPAVTASSVETGFTANADLSLTKTASAPSTGLGSNASASDAGDTISYTFEVTNTGAVTLGNLSINDLGVTFNSVPGTGAMGTINCPVGTLVPNQTTSCTADYTLSQTDIDNAIAGGANSVENTATASAQDPANATVTSPSSSATTSIASDSMIELTKSAAAPTTNQGNDASIVDPGDTIAFTIQVENTGNTSLSNVAISDSITSVTCPATTSQGNAFDNDGTDILNVGDSIVCSASYVLQITDLNAGSVSNTASVSSQDPQGANVDDSDIVISGFTQKAAIDLVKSGTQLPANPAAGDPITYNFALSNVGNVSLTNASVTDPNCDTPVSPLTFSNGYLSGDAGVAGELEVGETWLFECQYEISQPDIDVGEISNTAVGTGTPPAGSGLAAPSSTASNLAEAQQNAAISLIKTASLPSVTAGTLTSATDVGDTVSYSFEVENTGNVTLSNVQVTDPLITGAPNSGTINCPAGIASMAPGAQLTCTATYAITLDDVNSGQIGNTAEATGTPPMSVPPADAPVAQSSSVATISAAPELTVTKSVQPLPMPLAEGSLITYNYEVENTGNVTISGVAPVDAGPSFNGVAGTASLSAYAPANADLDPGESQLFTATYTVSQADLDALSQALDPLTGISNQATADGTPSQGTLPPVTASEAETGVQLSPLIELSKSSVAPTPALVGSLIQYTFELENTGDVSITNPQINDAQCSTPGPVLNFAAGYASGDTGAVTGVLDPGEIWVFNCSYAITQSDIDAGTVQNSALGSGEDPSGNLVQDTSDSTNPADAGGGADDPTNTPLQRTPSWLVSKSTNSSPMQAGDTLLYQFEVDNTGNVSISNVVVNDAKCAAAPVLVSGDTNADNVLDPLEVWLYECTSIGVTQAEVNAGTVDNSVSVSGMPPSGSPALPPATSSVMTPISANPALTLDKSSTPPSIGLGDLSSATDAGDTIVYTFVVTNTGNVTLSSLQVNDAGPTFGLPAAAGVGSWSGVTCPITSLLPQQSTSCTATYLLAQADIDAAIAAGADSVNNSATASVTPPIGSPVTSPTSSSSQTIANDPGVAIVKTAAEPTTALGSDPTLTDPNDTIDFTIVVENTGNTTLSNVLVSDDLTSVNCAANATPSGAPFVNTGAGTLAVGDSVICQATYTVQQADINAGQVINTASVTSTDPTGAVVDGVAEATSSFTQKTSLALEKTSNTLPPVPVADVSTLTYSFNLTNTGNVSLTDTQISDPRCQTPATPLTFGNGYVSGDSNTNNLFDAGETWLFQCDYVITQDDIDVGEISNVATATATPPLDSGLDAPSATASNLAEAEQNTGITLDKVAGMPTQSNSVNTQVGDTVTFTFNIENTGNVTLTDLDLDDPLITGSPNNGTLSCERTDVLMTPFNPATDSLSPGDSIICRGDYSLVQADIDAGFIGNTATVSATPPPTVPPIESPSAGSSSMVPIVADPTMSIDKTASVILATVEAGDTITYSYLVENTGNVTLDIVSPTDIGPTFNGVAGTNSLSPFNPAPLTLAPGQTQLFTATYELSQVDLDNMAASATPATAIANEASAEAEPANGPDPVVTPDVVETGVAPDPGLELIKTSVAPSPLLAGALVQYTFTLENTGNVTIRNPVINDPQCQSPASPLSFTSGYLSGDTGVIVGALDVDEVWTFSCDYSVTQADIDAGTVQNTAQAVGQDPAGNNVVDDSDTGNPGDGGVAGNDPTNTTLTRLPSWTVDKSTTSTPMNLGDTLVYSFLISNTGNVSISNVVVDDPKCQSAPVLDTNTDVGTDNVLSPAGAGGVPAAEQWVYSCTSVPIVQAELDATQVLNSVTVTGTAPGGAPAPASDNISTPVNSTPAMSLVKSAGAASLNADGTFDQAFDFQLKNTGNVTLTLVSINDDIPAQFGACFDSVIAAGSAALQDSAPLNDSLAPVVGVAPTLLTTATLSVGDAVTLSNYVVRFNPNAPGCTLPSPTQNTATANAATQASGNISDVSDNGIDPDLAGSNNAGLPTPFTPPAYAPELGAAKAAGIPVLNPDGSIDVPYTILIENTGNVDIRNLTLTDDLAAQFGAAFIASPAADPTGGVLVAPAVSVVADNNDANLVLPNTSSAFDGSAGANMFDGSSGYLGIGDRIEVTITVRLQPNAAGAPNQLLNTATVSGIDPSDTSVADDTDSGSDPSVNAGGPGTPTEVVAPLSMPILQLLKSGTLNPNGSIDYEFTVTNAGNVNVMDIVVSDQLLTDALVDVVIDIAVDADNDGDIDFLAPGQSVVVTANYPLSSTDFSAGNVENSATATGVDSTDRTVDDDSDSTNPADDTGADDDPTVTAFDAPSVGVAKALSAGSPVDLGNGTYQVSYDFVIQNTGPFDLSNVQLSDDLDAAINTPNVNDGAFSAVVVSSPNNTLTPSTTYNGASDILALSGTDTLLAGAEGRLQISFVFDPDVYFGPFFNQAIVSANNSAGQSIEDLSELGSTVNADSDSVTPFSLATPSTPITLGWFFAEQQGGELVISWTTEVEVSNAGFNLLYRDADNQWVAINPELIPAKGDSTDVQSYEYRTFDVTATEFKLIDVSVMGRVVEHGPFELGVEYGARAERRPTDWQRYNLESEQKHLERQQQLREKLRERLQGSKNQSSLQQSQGRSEVKSVSLLNSFFSAIASLIVPAAHAMDVASFEIENAGLYKVTHAQLLNEGIDLRGIDLDRIGLLQANSPWPRKFYPDGSTVFNSDSSLVFPAMGLQTLYTGKNKYTLVLDEASVMNIEADNSPVPENTAPAPSYLAEKSYAPQNKYTHLSPSSNDSWYADRLLALNSPASKYVSLIIDDYFPALNTGALRGGVQRMPVLRPRLEVNLWGGSNLPGNGLTAPDHHVLVELNDELVADETFDGLVEYAVERTLSNLQAGENKVNVTLPKDHGYQFDLVNLDRISIRYPRAFKAENAGHSLAFESSWRFFKVSELEDESVTVVRVDSQGQAFEMTTRYQGACQTGCVYFPGNQDGQSNTYYVSTSNGFATPKIELVDNSINIFSGQARYLIIAHPDFIDTPNAVLETYLDELQVKYGSADIVNVHDIYAKYSGHVVDANAIYSYIYDAVNERGTQHVLLVGGDNYDYHNNLNTNAKSFIPSLYVQIAANVNAVPSDAKFADIDDDFVPDISISRLPVRNDIELERLLSKRQNFLSRGTQGKAIFAADKIDNSGYSFKADAEAGIRQSFQGWDVTEVYMDDLEQEQARAELSSAINQGASLVAYYGHSSTDRWSISGLFTSDDASQLSNVNSPAVVTQWGCWNTFYVSPEQDGLAHRLLTDGEYGAVTIMGATSFTKADAEKKMADLLFANLSTGMTIGDAVLAAKRSIAIENPYQLDVLLGWTVLGTDDFSVTESINE